MNDEPRNINIDTFIANVTKPSIIFLKKNDGSCQKCLMMVAILNKVKDNIEIADKVDIHTMGIEELENFEESIHTYGISMLPYFLLVKDGSVKASYSGVIAEKLLIDHIKKDLGI